MLHKRTMKPKCRFPLFSEMSLNRHKKEKARVVVMKVLLFFHCSLFNWHLEVQPTARAGVEPSPSPTSVFLDVL